MRRITVFCVSLSALFFPLALFAGPVAEFRLLRLGMTESESRAALEMDYRTNVQIQTIRDAETRVVILKCYGKGEMIYLRIERNQLRSIRLEPEFDSTGDADAYLRKLQDRMGVYQHIIRSETGLPESRTYVWDDTRYRVSFCHQANRSFILYEDLTQQGQDDKKKAGFPEDLKPSLE